MSIYTEILSINPDTDLTPVHNQAVLTQTRPGPSGEPMSHSVIIPSDRVGGEMVGELMKFYLYGANRCTTKTLHLNEGAGIHVWLRITPQTFTVHGLNVFDTRWVCLASHDCMAAILAISKWMEGIPAEFRSPASLPALTGSTSSLYQRPDGLHELDELDVKEGDWLRLKYLPRNKTTVWRKSEHVRQWFASQDSQLAAEGESIRQQNGWSFACWTTEP